jgi:hypothetical protein
MLQLYFLSITTLGIGGLVLSIDFLEQKFPALANLKPIVSNQTFQFILGILAALFGFLKLLSVVEGDVPVVGDLIPALTGMIVGVTLVVGYYKSKATVQSETVEKMDNLFLKNRSVVGIGGLVVAILHFLMPSLLLL